MKPSCAAVELSQRYISDRFLPDKAIDLIDEAASRLRLEINSLPEDLEKTERRIRQLEIEREAIKREKDEAKLAVFQRNLLSYRTNGTKSGLDGKLRRDLVEEIQKHKKASNTSNLRLNRLSGMEILVLWQSLRYGKIREAENGIEAAKKKLTKVQGENPLINEEVGADEIAEIVRVGQVFLLPVCCKASVKNF
jgi:ATP-dependent Clp protease ATP-binding subunit ClpB